MTIGRGLALVGLIALLAGLWWGLHDPTERGPAPEVGDGPGGRSEHDTAPVADENRAPHELGSIRGIVERGGEPVSERVELRPLPEIDGDREAELLDHHGLHRPTPGPVLASRRATADGRFAFEDLEPGRYEVRAESGDGATSGRIIRVRPPEQHTTVFLDLPVGDVSLRGRILWADGRPWSGEVWAGGSSGARWSRAVRTDAQGRFVLDGLGVGFTVLTTDSGAGRVSYLGWIKLPTDEEPIYRIGVGETEMAGIILDDADGRPIPNARIVVDPSDLPYTATTRSGPDGRFRVPRPEKGSFELVVLASGYGSLPLPVEGVSGELTIRLVRAATITGRVLDAKTRNPVAGIPVRAARPVDGTDEAVVTGVTDREGRYRLEGLPAGMLDVLACGRGRISSGVADRGTGAEHPLRIEVRPGEEISVDLLVVPAATVAGRVVDSEGRGVPGATISFTLIDSAADGDCSLLEPSTVSGPDGSFRVAGLAPRLRHSGFAIEGMRHVTLATFLVPDGGLDDLVIRLPRMTRFEAIVTDEEAGRPVVGARVDFRCEAHPLDHFGSDTDGNGRAVRQAPREDLNQARARHDSHAPGDWQFLPDSGPVTLVLSRGEEVSGIVRTPVGAPAMGGTVRATQSESEGDSHVVLRSRSVAIGADGTFRVRGLQAGSVDLKVTITHAGRAIEGLATVVAPTAGLEFDMEDSDIGKDDPRFEVLLLDPSGRPIPFGHVRAYHTGSRVFEGWGDFGNVRFGRVVIPLSREGFDAIEVFGATDASGRPLPWGARWIGKLPEETDRLVVRLELGKSISGRVVDERGGGQRGVRVFADSYRGIWGFDRSRHATATTDDEGRFTLVGLEDRDYFLHLSVPEGSADPGPLRSAAGTTDVVVVLPEGNSRRIRILDPDGRPVRGVDVQARKNERGVTLSHGVTGAEGVVWLRAVPVRGPLILEVEPPDRRQDLLPRRIESWEPADGDVALEPAFVLSGRVIDATGKGVAEARVCLTAGDGRFTEVTGDANGWFRFHRQPAGEVTLVARGTGLTRTPESAEVTAAAGAENVRLVLAPGPEIRVRVVGEAGEPDDLYVRLFETEEPEENDCLYTHLDEEWRAVCRGLRSGTRYTLWISSFDTGRCCFQEGILPSDRELVVRLVPGRTIRGRLVFPAGVGPDDSSVEVSRQGQYESDPKPDERGEFLADGLPGGTYRVIAFAETDGRHYRAEADVEAGGSVVLTLRPFDPPDDD